MIKLMDQVILFDLGGVIAVPKDDRLLYQQLQTPLTYTQFLDYWWNAAPILDAHQGLITDETQIKALLMACQSPLTIAQFQQIYQDLPVQYYEGVIQIIKDLKAHHYRVGLLSNLRLMDYQRHAARIKTLPFDDLFLSYEMHALKPNADIYQQVITHYQCPAQNIIFFDDNFKNVTGACQCGIHAYQVTGQNPQQIREILAQELKQQK